MEIPPWTNNGDWDGHCMWWGRWIKDNDKHESILNEHKKTIAQLKGDPVLKEAAEAEYKDKIPCKYMGFYLISD